MLYVGRRRSRITMIVINKSKYDKILKTAEYAIKQSQVYSFRPMDNHNGIVGLWRGEEVLLCPDNNKVCDKCKYRFLCYTERCNEM